MRSRTFNYFHGQVNAFGIRTFVIVCTKCKFCFDVVENLSQPQHIYCPRCPNHESVQLVEDEEQKKVK